MNNIKLTNAEQDHINKLLSGNLSLNDVYKNNNLTYCEKKYLQCIYENEKYISTIECAVWLDKSLRTIYRYIESGNIVYIKIGGDNNNYRIDVEKTKEKLGLA